MNIGKIAVIVPTMYAAPEWLPGLVSDLNSEPDVAKLFLIENGGKSRPATLETVRPHTLESGMGWLRATNHGLGVAASQGGFLGYCLLNDDVRLSPNFFHYILEAWRITGAGLVASCYYSTTPGRCAGRPEFFPRPMYSGLVSGYQTRPVDREVGWMDGTFLFIPADTYRALGPLDDRFHEYGWGATDVYSFRTKDELGKPLFVTERTLVDHFGRATADARWSNYDAEAWKEKTRILREAGYPDWKTRQNQLQSQQ